MPYGEPKEELGVAAARAGVLKFQGEDIFLIMLIREGGAVRVPPHSPQGYVLW